MNINHFTIAKIIGFGIALWISVSVISFMIMNFGVDEVLFNNGVLAIIAGIVAFLFALNLKIPTIAEAALYGFSWAIIGALLDLGVDHGFDWKIINYTENWWVFVMVVLAPIVYGVGVLLLKWKDQ